MTEYNATDTLRKNLDELSLRSSMTGEQRKICLTLLISELIADTDNDTAEVIYSRFRDLVPEASGSEKLMLCKALLESPSLISEELRESMLALSEDTAAGSHAKVAYVRNKYNDMAFDIFGKALSNAKQVHSPSFSEACEEVLDNRAEFCIMPIEDSGDGRLFRFYSMLDRYDLKILSTCELETEDHAKMIRYALAGKGLTEKNLNSLLKKKQKQTFEFSLVAPDALFLSDVTEALKSCGALPQKIDSLPVEYDHNMRRFFFNVHIAPSELCALCLYLSLEFSSYTFIGSYPCQK